MDRVHELTSYFCQTGYFETIHEARVLAHIVSIPRIDTVKTICQETGMHNSNVYPAFKSLENKGLIQRNDTERPVAYFVRSPEVINEYLENAFEVQIGEKMELIKKIYQLLLTFWDAKKRDQLHFSHIFKGKAIKNEIIKLLRQTKQKITCIIGPKFYPYASIILDLIEELLDRNLHIWIAIPFTEQFIESFASIYQNKNPLLKIKKSIWMNRSYHNSYIISDNTVLLNITHRRIGDDAILTNDTQIISHVLDKWNDKRCIQSFNAFELLETAQDAEIKI